MNCPPGKSIIFHKKETEKIELVARPAGNLKSTFSSIFSDYQMEVNLSLFFADHPKRSLRRAAASTGAVVPVSTTSTAPVGGVAVRTNTQTRAGKGNGSTARHPQNTTKSGPGAEIKDTTDLSLNKIRYLISLSKIQFALFQS